MYRQVEDGHKRYSLSQIFFSLLHQHGVFAVRIDMFLQCFFVQENMWKCENLR